MSKFEKGQRVFVKKRSVSEYAGMDLVGKVGVITLVGYDRQYEVNHTSGYYHEDDLLTLEEAQKTENIGVEPEFVRLSRNTELYKKGTVFKLNTLSNRYEALSRESAFIDDVPGFAAVIASKTVMRLPNTFVPVIKFDPEYVTLDENDRLQKVLKTPVKKGKK